MEKQGWVARHLAIHPCQLIIPFGSAISSLLFFSSLARRCCWQSCTGYSPCWFSSSLSVGCSFLSSHSHSFYKRPSKLSLRFPCVSFHSRVEVLKERHRWLSDCNICTSKSFLTPNIQTFLTVGGLFWEKEGQDWLLTFFPILILLIQAFNSIQFNSIFNQLWISNQQFQNLSNVQFISFYLIPASLISLYLKQASQCSHLKEWINPLS